MSRAWWARVSLVERGDIERDTGEILEHHRARRTTLEPSERLHVGVAGPAAFDHRVQATGLGHERDERVVIVFAAVRTVQRPGMPLALASAASEKPGSLDAPRFRQCR